MATQGSRENLRPAHLVQLHTKANAALLIKTVSVGRNTCRKAPESPMHYSPACTGPADREPKAVDTATKLPRSKSDPHRPHPVTHITKRIHCQQSDSGHQGTAQRSCRVMSQGKPAEYWA